MSTHIKRRTYRRLGLLMGAGGLLVIGTMLGVVGDEEPSVAGFVLGIVMVVAGGWSVVKSQRIGRPRE